VAVVFQVLMTDLLQAAFADDDRQPPLLSPKEKFGSSPTPQVGSVRNIEMLTSAVECESGYERDMAEVVGRKLIFT